MEYLRFLRDNKAFLSAGALLTYGSSFGQTYFIAIFAAHIMGAFELTDGQWGGLYTLGTTLSALAMIWAGMLTDHFRARHLAWVVLPGLALACLVMSTTPNAAVLVGAIFLLRLFGQGMMSHLAVVSTARWFKARRGRALAIVSMGFAVAQAIMPVIFVALLASFGWRTLWVVCAGLSLLLVPILTRLLRYERTPQSVAAEVDVAGMGNRHWTRLEVLRHPLFWLSVPLLLGPPAWGTALFFQQVHLAEVKGWPLVDYVALLPIFTIAAIGATFLSGILIDRFGTARLMTLFMLPFAVAFAVIGQAETLAGAALGLFIVGIGQGLQPTLPPAYWAEFFGTRHLGSIKAMAAAIMVFGSAIGPGVTGYLIDRGFDFPEQMMGIAVYFLIAAACITIGIRRARRTLPVAA